jgi:hypothetical protein
MQKMRMRDIDKMSFNQWINYREKTLDKLESLGFQLLPTVGCGTCDIPNEYICFDCESNFIYDSREKYNASI